jgi:hypothetical protein
VQTSSLRSADDARARAAMELARLDEFMRQAIVEAEAAGTDRGELVAEFAQFREKVKVELADKDALLAQQATTVRALRAQLEALEKQAAQDIATERDGFTAYRAQVEDKLRQADALAAHNERLTMEVASLRSQLDAARTDGRSGDPAAGAAPLPVVLEAPVGAAVGSGVIPPQSAALEAPGALRLFEVPTQERAAEDDRNGDERPPPAGHDLFHASTIDSGAAQVNDSQVAAIEAASSDALAAEGARQPAVVEGGPGEEKRRGTTEDSDSQDAQQSRRRSPSDSEQAPGEPGSGATSDVCHQGPRAEANGAAGVDGSRPERTTSESGGLRPAQELSALEQPAETAAEVIDGDARAAGAPPSPNEWKIDVQTTKDEVGFVAIALHAVFGVCTLLGRGATERDAVLNLSHQVERSHRGPQDALASLTAWLEAHPAKPIGAVPPEAAKPGPRRCTIQGPDDLEADGHLPGCDRTDKPGVSGAEIDAIVAGVAAAAVAGPSIIGKPAAATVAWPRWGTAAGPHTAWHLWPFDGAGEALCEETTDAEVRFEEDASKRDPDQVCADCREISEVAMPKAKPPRWLRGEGLIAFHLYLAGARAAHCGELLPERHHEFDGTVSPSERLCPDCSGASYSVQITAARALIGKQPGKMPDIETPTAEDIAPPAPAPPKERKPRKPADLSCRAPGCTSPGRFPKNSTGAKVSNVRVCDLDAARAEKAAAERGVDVAVVLREWADAREPKKEPKAGRVMTGASATAAEVSDGR